MLGGFLLRIRGFMQVFQTVGANLFAFAFNPCLASRQVRPLQVRIFSGPIHRIVMRAQKMPFALHSRPLSA